MADTNNIMDAVGQVSAAFEDLAKDVSTALVSLSDQKTSVQASLDSANAALTTIQANGRPEDRQAITDLRNALDNMTVNNGNDTAVQALNTLALRIRGFDQNVQGAVSDGTVEPGEWETVDGHNATVIRPIENPVPPAVDRSPDSVGTADGVSMVGVNGFGNQGDLNKA